MSEYEAPENPENLNSNGTVNGNSNGAAHPTIVALPATQTVARGAAETPAAAPAAPTFSGNGASGGPPPDNTDFAASAPTPGPENLQNSRDEEQDLFSHLAELRLRILRSVGVLLLMSCVTWAYGTPISNWFLLPATRALSLYAPTGSHLVTTDPTEGFMTYLEISVIFALIITMPYILWELWAFVEPALTSKERRYSGTLIPFSIGLFVIGAAFGYLLSPMFFKFFLAFQGDATALWTKNKTVAMMGKTLLVFGICFQVPVVTVFVNKIGLVSRNVMIEYWRHVVVAIFCVVSIIAPTWDPVTLCVCSLPPCLLYLFSLWLIKWL